MLYGGVNSEEHDNMHEFQELVKDGLALVFLMGNTYLKFNLTYVLGLC